MLPFLLSFAVPFYFLKFEHVSFQFKKFSSSYQFIVVFEFISMTPNFTILLRDEQ